MREIVIDDGSGLLGEEDMRYSGLSQCICKEHAF